MMRSASAGESGAAMHDEPVDRRHAVGDGRARLRLHEPQIALRQQPEQPAAVVDDDERADARARHQRRAPRPGGAPGAML